MFLAMACVFVGYLALFLLLVGVVEDAMPGLFVLAMFVLGSTLILAAFAILVKSRRIWLPLGFAAISSAYLAVEIRKPWWSLVAASLILLSLFTMLKPSLRLLKR